MDMLQRNGIETELIKLNTDVDFDNIRSFQVYGVYPFSFGKVLGKIKEAGKLVIYDNDDAIDLIEPTNPFYYAVKKDSSSHGEIIQYADHLTVSTERMKELMSKKTKAPITVVPNCYSELEWTFPRPKREGIRIGFSGSSTHVMDLIHVLPIIKKLQDENRDIIFLISGFGQGSYEEWRQQFAFVSPPEATKLLDELHENIKDIKFEWIPFVDTSVFPQVLTNMALDIGICPLLDTPFNNARSACKALEYTLSGALTLASDLTPYQSEPTSVLVKPDEWEEKLTYFIENPNEREEKRQEHLKWIKENREINSLLPLLKSIYLP